MTELELSYLDRAIKDTLPTSEEIVEGVAEYKKFKEEKELKIAKDAYYEAYGIKPTIEEANAEGFDTL